MSVRTADGPTSDYSGSAALLAALVLVTVPAFGQDGEDRIQEQGGVAYVPGEVVVAEEGGGYAVREVGAETLSGIKEEAEEIEQEKDVLVAGPNYAYEPSFVPNDPFFNQQYNLSRIRARGAWEYSRGRAISIGFVDTSCYAAHPDLDAKARNEYDFVGEDEVAQDFDYHGTAVVDVAAPGVDIISTYNPDYSENTTGALYARFSGTSLAAAHVAGVAALVKAEHPSFKPKKLARHIKKSATDLGKRGLDDTYGRGLLNAR